jgi:hypothetical protein
MNLKYFQLYKLHLKVFYDFYFKVGKNMLSD